jgi:hypothetical protein
MRTVTAAVFANGILAHFPSAIPRLCVEYTTTVGDDCSLAGEGTGNTSPTTPPTPAPEERRGDQREVVLVAKETGAETLKQRLDGWRGGGGRGRQPEDRSSDRKKMRGQRCGVKSCNHAFLAKTMSVHVSARFQDPHLVVPTLLLFFRVLVSDISGSALALVGERWATKASGRRMRTGSRRR